jgi:hypothetical protein
LKNIKDLILFFFFFRENGKGKRGYNRFCPTLALGGWTVSLEACAPPLLPIALVTFATLGKIPDRNNFGEE